MITEALWSGQVEQGLRGEWNEARPVTSCNLGEINSLTAFVIKWPVSSMKLHSLFLGVGGNIK